MRKGEEVSLFPKSFLIKEKDLWDTTNSSSSSELDVMKPPDKTTKVLKKKKDLWDSTSSSSSDYLPHKAEKDKSEETFKIYRGTVGKKHREIGSQEKLSKAMRNRMGLTSKKPPSVKGKKGKAAGDNYSPFSSTEYSRSKKNAKAGTFVLHLPQGKGSYRVVSGNGWAGGNSTLVSNELRQIETIDCGEGNNGNQEPVFITPGNSYIKRTGCDNKKKRGVALVRGKGGTFFRRGKAQYPVEAMVYPDYADQDFSGNVEGVAQVLQPPFLSQLSLLILTLLIFIFFVVMFVIFYN